MGRNRQWAGHKRKRGHDDGGLGVGDTLSKLRRDSQDSSFAESPLEALNNSHEKEADKPQGQDEGWQVVGTKRRKKNDANFPAITHSVNARLQGFVKISDLQSLVLYLLADGYAPQWVSVRHHKEIEKVVVVMVPGLEAEMFNGNIPLTASQETVASKPTYTFGADDRKNGEGAGDETASLQQPHGKLSISPDDYYPTKLASQKLPEPLEPLAHIFPHIWPIKTPGEYNRMHSPLYAMLSAPIPKPKEHKKIKGPKPPAEGKNWKNNRTAISEYIASREELEDNGFVLHPAHLHSEAERESETSRRQKACQSADDGWVDVLDIQALSEGSLPDADVEAGSVLQGRDLLVVDCEMVTTSTDKFALARISIIDWNGKTILDELVKPPDRVTDYLTPYSGITKQLLDTATMTLADIQKRLQEILKPHTVLAGHSLDSDLRALKISYPFIVDTALLYPHPKGPPQKSSLKWLCQKYLSREIQNRGGQGHDSVEDAQACLDLVKQKCERGKLWGTPDATGEPIFKRLERGGQDELENSVKGHAQGKTGAVVDWGNPMRGFGAAATVSIPCETDQEVVDGVKRAVLGDKADTKIPKGGCDFVWARLRELEALRGWFDKSRINESSERLAKVASTTTSDDTKAETNGSTNANSTTSPPPSQSTAPNGDLSSTALATAVSRTISHITTIHSFLPERTALIVYSGSGDPRDLVRMQSMQREFKAAYNTMKWDELPVKWTDVEEQTLKAAAVKARGGIGFLCVKGPEVEVRRDEKDEAGEGV